jgi:solute:Na+ symporter, SSS family
MSAGIHANIAVGLVICSIVMLFSIVIGVAGIYAYKINPHLPSHDLTLPWLILHALPAGIGAVVVVSVMAAILSCANSNAFAVGSFFVRHIFPLATGHYPQKSVPTARKALAGALVVSTLVALHTSSIVDFIIKFLPVTMSGISVVILMGRFWKRANWQGALAALLTTPLISLSVILIPAQTKFWGYPVIPAVIAGAAVQFLVSALTSPTPISWERQAIEQDPAGSQPANTATNNRKPVAFPENQSSCDDFAL